MALNFLLDTNILLYHMGARLLDRIPAGNQSISVMTEIELLSYPSIAPAEEQLISKLLANIQVVELSEPIKHEAIRVRKAHRLKLPDAIIVASALVIGATLVSNDVRLANVQGLFCS